jgi:hypothetical protein
LVPEVVTLVSHEIDHIAAAKHGGETTAENLALCCTLCNKYKGTDLASIDPETGEMQRLFHPRRDRWLEHFQFQAGESYRSPLSVESQLGCFSGTGPSVSRSGN